MIVGIAIRGIRAASANGGITTGTGTPEAREGTTEVTRPLLEMLGTAEGIKRPLEIRATTGVTKLLLGMCVMIGTIGRLQDIRRVSIVGTLVGSAITAVGAKTAATVVGARTAATAVDAMIAAIAASAIIAVSAAGGTTAGIGVGRKKDRGIRATLP